MTWAVAQRVPAMQKLVLLMLANRTNHDTGMCIPRIKTLADECGMSETACKNALKALAASDHIRVESRFDEGIQKPNQYHLNWQQVPANDPVAGVGRQTPTVGRETPGGGRQTPPGGSPNAPGVGRQTPTEPGSIKPVIEPKELLGDSAEFEQAWQAYPKRAGGNSKADALKAWKARLKERVLPNRMLEGVRRYAAFCEATEKTGTEYVKQAATFFGPALHFDEPWTPPPPKKGAGMFNRIVAAGWNPAGDDLFGERTGT